MFNPATLKWSTCGGGKSEDDDDDDDDDDYNYHDSDKCNVDFLCKKALTTRQRHIC